MDGKLTYNSQHIYSVSKPEVQRGPAKTQDLSERFHLRVFMQESMRKDVSHSKTCG